MAICTATRRVWCALLHHIPRGPGCPMSRKRGLSGILWCTSRYIPQYSGELLAPVLLSSEPRQTHILTCTYLNNEYRACTREKEHPNNHSLFLLGPTCHCQVQINVGRGQSADQLLSRTDPSSVPRQALQTLRKLTKLFSNNISIFVIG